MPDPDLRERVIEGMRSIRAETAGVSIIQGAVAADGRNASLDEIREQCDELVEDGVLSVASDGDDREYRFEGVEEPDESSRHNGG